MKRRNCFRKVVLPLLGLLAVPSSLAVWTVKQATAEQYVQIWANIWYGDESVRAGDELLRGNTPYPVLNHVGGQLLYFQLVLRYSFLALLGEVYLPSAYKIKDLDFLKESDPEGQFCRSMLDYFWVFPSHPMNRGTRQDMNDFVHYCRDEYAKLSVEEQNVLRPLREAGPIPQSILLPTVLDAETVKRDHRKNPVPPYHAGKLEENELRDLLTESMQASTWKGVVDGVPDAVLKYYQTLDLRKLPQTGSTWTDIRRAIQGGRVAGFDARPLFPAELFNATPAVLADREGEDAARIPVLADMCSAISLRDWGLRVERLRQSNARVAFNLADRQAMAKEETPDVTTQQKEMVELSRGVGNDYYCDAGYIHTRRMPRLHASLPDVVSKLGMQDDILRVQSYLWMGALRGGFHYDEEANIYVQLVGEADIWIIPQNYTNPLLGGVRHADPPSQETLRSDPYWKEVPIHIFRLHPGEGITFPAFTFHLVCAQSIERVALNFFFIPKWRRMEYSQADWYHQEAERPHGLERLAVRQLWARSFSRLWDEKRRGLICNAFKNEYL